MLVPNAHEQHSSFGRSDGDLPDDFVEGLAEELLADRTNAFRACLAVLEGLIQGLLESHHIGPFGLLVRDVLHKVLAVGCLPVSGQDHVVEDV